MSNVRLKHTPGVCSREPYCRTVLQSWQDKPSNASLKKQPIIEYSPGFSQDTEPLRSCSGNRPKMLLKSHIWTKCHSQYIWVIRLLQDSSANSYWGACGCNVRDLETITVLVSLTFYKFHPTKVTLLTNLADNR